MIFIFGHRAVGTDHLLSTPSLRYGLYMSTIKDRVKIVLQGDPILPSQILRGWPLHGWTHEAGGIDEISVEDLSGLLADPQNAGWIDDYAVDLTVPPTDGQVLTWDSVSLTWIAADVNVEVTAGVTSVNGEDGDLFILGSDYIGVTTVDPSITISLLDHVVTHANGGDDELNVGGLSGLLADPQNAGWIDGYAVDLSTAPGSGDVLSWSGTAWVAAAPSGGSPASLSEGAIGYGSASNLLTGDATRFTFDAATRQMFIGQMTPGHLSTTNDSLGVVGDVEIDGLAWLDGGAQVASGAPLRLGPNHNLKFDTDQTVPSPVLWLHSGSNTLSIAELSDAGNDLGGVATSEPRLKLFGPGAALDNKKHVDHYHDGVDAYVHSYLGSIVFRDEYLDLSTSWVSKRQRLYSSDTEVEAIFALLGNAEGSVAAAILAAAQTGVGGDLDDAYDYGGSGVGRSMQADAGAVAIYNTAGENPLLSLTATSGTQDLLTISNTADVGSVDILLTGDRGTSDFSAAGHIIEANGAATFYGNMSAYGDALLHFWVDAGETDTPVATLYVEDGSTADVSYIDVGAATGIFANTDQTITLQSALSVILQPANDTVYCTTSRLEDVKNVTYTASTGASYSSGILTVDFLAGYQIMEVNASGSVTSLSITNAPAGLGIFHIYIKNTAAGAISVGGFPSGWKWDGNYNLYAASPSLPAGDAMHISVTYLSGGAYRAQAVTEKAS